jgi:inhibitor of cysteine peptidase
MHNLKRNSLFLLASLLAAIALAACGATVDPTTEPGQEPPGGGGGIVEGEATVETVEILLLESFPVQVNVVVTGYLADGCTQIDEVITERQGDTFDVTITTTRDADAVCTQAIVPFEQTIELDVLSLEAGTYTVDVNGVTETFTLDVDNA